ncbi:unnamed protein product [Prunus armeniaca]|uniref:Uncharacterized protein n=1 Tax=Prunus armeniaca TaxID=36596 RepID=A0A6J5XGZ8_PRUAR|nr:unnamed protein product [Prunus armeniaca]
MIISIAFNVGDHYTPLCSYVYEVLEDAIVGESCVVTCLVCGCLFRDSRCANCGISLGRARIKYCSICEKRGEHLPFECPKRDRNSGFTYNPYNGSFSVKIHPLKPVEKAEPEKAPAAPNRKLQEEAYKDRGEPKSNTNKSQGGQRYLPGDRNWKYNK